ncbi:unnamed protein product [Anisakis simplex]|uniref:Ovule protein n=1 Tax=Anisakis simplex TaxID=6269 RepID=A0A0M3JC56_ANISI|nr:unnamed protein product [Anisakis simplex]
MNEEHDASAPHQLPPYVEESLVKKEIQTSRDEARNDQCNMELKPMASSSGSDHHSIFLSPIPIVKTNL